MHWSVYKKSVIESTRLHQPLPKLTIIPDLSFFNELFQIINLCLDYICYDPNYNYDDDEDEDAMDAEEDDEEGWVPLKKPCIFMSRV